MMKCKLKFVFLITVFHITLLPFNLALALVVNPMGIDNVDRTNKKLPPSLAVLAVEIPSLEVDLNPQLTASPNNLPVIESKATLGIQRFIPPWMYLNVRGVVDGFSPSPIPTPVLLIGTSLIGLIGIARRSFFTR